MSRYERFHYPNAGELRKRAEQLGLDLPFQDCLDPLFSPLRLQSTVLPNRMVVQPMEGCDAETAGAPGELTFRRYLRYARGGSGIIWFEACSISAEGRSNARQLWLTNHSLPEFQRLVEATRNAAHECSLPAPYLVLQLTDSGRRSLRLPGSKARAVCFNPNFDNSPEDIALLQDDDLERIADQFTGAAMRACKAGFDAVDVKACHGYLVHELLSAFTRENSRFGGCFENRSRLLLDVVRRIRDSVPNLGLAVRLNATDAVPYPYGFGMETTGARAPDFSEPLMLQRLLMDAGCRLLSITAGIPFHIPHVGRPFDRPAHGDTCPETNPLSSVCDLVRWTSVFQSAHPSLPVVGTGYSWLRHFWPHVAAAAIARNRVSLVGLGRGSFAYPDAPWDLREHGRLIPGKCCVACSCCTDLMRSHRAAGCVIRDPEIYKGIYQRLQ